MLKELNAIAGGLLGLEGYPTKPLWSNPAPRGDTVADPRHPSTHAPEHVACANDDPSHGRPALNC